MGVCQAQDVVGETSNNSTAKPNASTNKNSANSNKNSNANPKGQNNSNNSTSGSGKKKKGKSGGNNNNAPQTNQPTPVISNNNQPSTSSQSSNSTKTSNSRAAPAPTLKRNNAPVALVNGQQRPSEIHAQIPPAASFSQGNNPSVQINNAINASRGIPVVRAAAGVGSVPVVMHGPSLISDAVGQRGGKPPAQSFSLENLRLPPGITITKVDGPGTGQTGPPPSSVSNVPQKKPGFSGPHSHHNPSPPPKVPDPPPRIPSGPASIVAAPMLPSGRSMNGGIGGFPAGLNGPNVIVVDTGKLREDGEVHVNGTSIPPEEAQTSSSKKKNKKKKNNNNSNNSGTNGCGTKPSDSNVNTIKNRPPAETLSSQNHMQQNRQANSSKQMQQQNQQNNSKGQVLKAASTKNILSKNSSEISQGQSNQHVSEKQNGIPTKNVNGQQNHLPTQVNEAVQANRKVPQACTVVKGKENVTQQNVRRRETEVNNKAGQECNGITQVISNGRLLENGRAQPAPGTVIVRSAYPFPKMAPEPTQPSRQCRRVHVPGQTMTGAPPCQRVGNGISTTLGNTVGDAVAAAAVAAALRSKKKKKKKGQNGQLDDWNSVDSVFAPKEDIDLENGDIDDDERELEAFKRFCFNSVPLERKEKVHLNIKDIVLKKKHSVLGCS
ncbi:hypothetical protein J437_LFUL013178 [Ladona fulva]|uniref:FAM193 C-terminal domain-containing protein n=1 Tax=Ladona fulva TaxID=123851 RepID=A0A8K0KJE8_LADFU|nr:hypothetical protein J437_LFUL013178 [Ladona fulva]